jgi:hypothetical protein
MFKQIYESAPVPYRLPTGDDAIYNGYLTTPPRIYAEELFEGLVFSVFSRKESTPNGETTIYVLSAVQQIYYPSWGLWMWKFDGSTGAYISREDAFNHSALGTLGVLFMRSIIESYTGSFWVSFSTGHTKEMTANLQTILQEFDAAHFGRSTIDLSLGDSARDLIMMPGQAGSGSNVCVYTISTGELVRTITVSGSPIAICAEDDKRVYVLGSNFILNLLDYTTGEIISTYRVPVPDDAIDVRVTWDRLLRRLLVFLHLPNAEDGASTSVVRGYYPVPVAMHLTEPIPLKPVRKGQNIPVLIRAVGDVGEPIAGKQVALTLSGATLLRNPAGTDANGAIVASVRCDDTGTFDIDASTDNGL